MSSSRDNDPANTESGKQERKHDDVTSRAYHRLMPGLMQSNPHLRSPNTRKKGLYTSAAR